MLREVIKNDPSPYVKYIEYIEEDKVLGYLKYSLIYDRMEIDNVLVEPEYRGQKIGNKLMSRLISIAIEEHVVNITLEVRVSNEIARNLYRKFGFRDVALRKFYYGDEDAIVLSQIDIHKNYGGVVPEIASRNHIENITIVLEELLSKANMKLEDITAIGVTYGPGLIGSLLIGVQAAKTISLVTGKPLIPVHHIIGHIYANNLKERLTFPLIALVVSGGHTELIYMKEDYSFTKIGGTLDDAVGECYDKVAKVLGLEYPGGPKVDKLAHLGKDTYNLPYPLDDSTYNFSFSGIKSAVINLVHNEEQRGNTINKENLCTTFQNRVVGIITKKTMKAIKEYKVSNLVVAGGVSANSGLREKLTEECQKENIHISFPELKYCTDNATMIAAAAYFAYQKNIFADLTLNAMATDTIYKEWK